MEDEAGGFTALNGTRYENQIDVGGCMVHISDNVAAAAKELRQLNLSLKLAGKYWFSNPPPWTDEKASEPPKEKRQWDWATPWKYQVEV